jgi:putative sugar O-methyltransferase
MNHLLNRLLEDEKLQNKRLYSSGEYWSKKNLKTIYQLKKKDLYNFRGLDSGVGTSFVDNVVTNINNELNILGRLTYKFFKLPFLKNLNEKQIELTLSHARDLLKSQALLYSSSSLVQKLIEKYKFSNTVNHGCCQKFTFNEKEYSFLYLEIANRINNISKFLNFRSFHSFFEIGGGFGANVDFIINNFSNIKKIIYLDAVPNIYVGTMYLKSKFRDNVIDYTQTRKLEKIQFSKNNNLEIICIAPWQIEKLNVEVDHFHNASSFVEMPEEIIENYLKYIFKNKPKSLSLLTYGAYDPNTTIDPHSLNRFFKDKLDIYEFSTAVPGLEKKDIYYIKEY